MSIHYSALSQLHKLQDAQLWANYLTSVSLKMGVTNISLAACKLNETTYVQGLEPRSALRRRSLTTHWLRFQF